MGRNEVDMELNELTESLIDFGVTGSSPARRVGMNKV